MSGNTATHKSAHGPVGKRVTRVRRAHVGCFHPSSACFPTLLIDERTDTVTKLYSVDISKATNILVSPWDDAATTPSLEALDDPAAHSIVPLSKTLVADLSKLPGVPDKVEGLVALDQITVAIVSDNDFDISKFDENGNNVGEGVPTKIVVIGLPQPLP